MQITFNFTFILGQNCGPSSLITWWHLASAVFSSFTFCPNSHMSQVKSVYEWNINQIWLKCPSWFGHITFFTVPYFVRFFGAKCKLSILCSRLVKFARVKPASFRSSKSWKSLKLTFATALASCFNIIDLIVASDASGYFRGWNLHLCPVLRSLADESEQLVS